ncbi:MAG: hypothetical protein C4584_02485 [Armatimonadetes bacterium]|nr:MAG: hypothetical protein C4584_02485 [Armatimonadota bacterium]
MIAFKFCFSTFESKSTAKLVCQKVALKFKFKLVGGKLPPTTTRVVPPLHEPKGSLEPWA